MKHRVEACPRGHRFTAANTLKRTNGARECRACKREKARERYEQFFRALAVK